MYKTDCVVIGAGVVGLAIARKLAMLGREVIVLESQGNIGTGTSSRNSEVIHAGIYYTPNSLKAKLCVLGKKYLYQYCKDRSVPYAIPGKFIVATHETHIEQLLAIKANACANGVEDMTLLHDEEAKRLEPALQCKGALLSPSTGIINSHALMLSYQADLEEAKGQVILYSPVIGGEVGKAGRIVLHTGGKDPTTILAHTVINCAGLHAIHVAASFKGFPSALLPEPFYVKGNYFSFSGKAPFRKLIYPVPEKNGLGIHTTLDLSGAMRLGPDTEIVEVLDYAVDMQRKHNFYQAAKTYWPTIPEDRLFPAFSGIRPKLKNYNDFMVQGFSGHGIKGLINLFGIDSPGLTASLAIAEYVETLL